MKTIPNCLFVSLLLAVLSIGGCSQNTKVDPLASTSGTPAARDGLLDLGQLLIELKASGDKVPATTADFAKHDVVHPAAGALCINGTIVYLFGASIDASDKTLKLVGMQKDADKMGGWVLLSNGDVKDLTAAEVVALPAGGKMPKK